MNDNTETMPISETLAALNSRLTKLGWEPDEAALYVDGLMHAAPGEDRRVGVECNILWACHNNDALDLVGGKTQAKAEWDAVLFEANAAVMA